VRRYAHGDPRRAGVLVEGVPGLAKTMAVRTLAMCSTWGQELQVTPSKAQQILIGTMVYRRETGGILPRIGPVSRNSYWLARSTGPAAKVLSDLWRRWRNVR
jgi:MoxR-like ATPase